MGIEDFQYHTWRGKAGFSQKIERFVCKNADSVIAPSNYLKGLVAQWGVDSDKIRVVYNSIATSQAPKAASDGNRISILSVGRLVPWKGFSALIQCMPDLIKENVNYTLTILGEGPDRDKLLHLISELHLQNSVKIVKTIGDGKKQYFDSAKIFILNTAYEGFSHTILEAMSYGVPIITTNVCGNPEIIKEGYNGLLVEHDNKDQIKEAIRKLNQNSDLRDMLIKNSKDTLNKFTQEQMMQNIINVFKELSV